MSLIRSQRRIYGRRLGRALNTERKAVLERLLPVLQIPDNLVTENTDMTAEKLFDASFDQMWLEIGFGNGEHLSAVMRQNPKNAYIGAEPFINGMSAFLVHVPSSARQIEEAANSPLNANPSPSRQTEIRFIKNSRVFLSTV